MKRDNYFRCKHCHQIFTDDECFIDPIRGFLCPNGCEEPYEQPPYESPLQEDNTKKV